MNPIKPKVFGVGFHKTGTTSLRDALRYLGYRVTGPDFKKAEDLDDGLVERAVELAKHFDAFQDNPWPLLFREMDEIFPGSKFILTLRDEESWYASALRHFGSAETPRRKFIYGVGAPLGNEGIYKSRFRKHNADVISYFAGRPNDFLVMELAKGDGWEKLCRFLGHPVPDLPFPHSKIGRVQQ